MRNSVNSCLPLGLFRCIIVIVMVIVIISIVIDVISIVNAIIIIVIMLTHLLRAELPAQWCFQHLHSKEGGTKNMNGICIWQFAHTWAPVVLTLQTMMQDNPAYITNMPL